MAEYEINITQPEYDINILNLKATDADLDAHTEDTTIHFTEGSIDHTNIQNVGDNTHTQIDSHIADNDIHFELSAISITKSQISDFSDGDYDASGTASDLIGTHESTYDHDLTPYSTISYNTSIADVSYSGKDITITAGENVAFGNVVYLKSDGKLWKTDADAEATSKGMLALAVATIAGDASGKFLTQGIARNDAWNWTVGGTLYLSTDAGALTQTAPSGNEDIVRIVGHAITADIIFFNPSNEYVELEVA